MKGFVFALEHATPNPPKNKSGGRTIRWHGLMHVNFTHT